MASSSRLLAPEHRASLTPRTPRSHSHAHEHARRRMDGRAEYEPVGLAQGDNHHYHDDDNDAGQYAAYATQQTVPLLASSNTADAASPFSRPRRATDMEPSSTGNTGRGKKAGGRARPGTGTGTGTGTAPAARAYGDVQPVPQRKRRVCDGRPLAAGVLAALLLALLLLLAVVRPAAVRRFFGGAGDAAAPAAAASAQANGGGAAQTSLGVQGLLSAEEYASACWGKHPGGHVAGAQDGYWGATGASDALHTAPASTVVVDADKGAPRVCTSTITYMLDGRVGLLADLALLAQVAALARERNRTLFIEDSTWNRGKWTDHFLDVRVTQPGVEPGCAPPHPKELVACPRTARHWVVNWRTAKFHFGGEFTNAYEDAYGRELNRLKPIFDAAYASFAQTIRPNAHTASLIRAARDEVATAHAGKASVAYTGVHLRRGDRMASSWRLQYQHTAGGVISIADYVSAAADAMGRLFPRASASASAAAAAAAPTTPPAPQTKTGRKKPPQKPRVWLASDSPWAHDQFVVGARLWWVMSLHRSTLPALRALASPRAYVQREFEQVWSAEARVMSTRGMLVDLALVSGMWAETGDEVPVATMCAVGSNVCKMAAVGLGWERAFGPMNSSGNIVEDRKGWVDVENDDQVSPIWRAFELF